MKEKKKSENLLNEEEKIDVEDKDKVYKNSAKKVITLLEEEVTTLKRDLEKYKNQYYETYADIQNLRKKIEKEHNAAIKYRLEGFISDLLPVLDSFHVALANEPPSEETKNYLIGFKYIYSNLVNILEQEGVKEITPKIGDKFDDEVMQAIDIEEVDSKKKENLVTKLALKGYKLHDHLVRPAMVVVSKHQKDIEKEEK